MARVWNFFTQGGTGRLLDLFIFLLNFLLMPWIAVQFNSLIRRAGQADQAAGGWLLAIGISMLVLAPLGATLKRWHAHQGRGNGLSDPMGSCLFNPIFYLCLMFVVFAAVNAYLIQEFFGRSEPPGDIFLSSICAGIVLCIAHTWLVYRYFSKPERPPRWGFLQTSASARLGDLFLFANATLFQLFWNMLVDIGFPRVSSAGEALLRIPLLAFMALLLYFPPRMFYLAREGMKGSDWLSMLVANSPTIFRFVIGVKG